MYARSDDAAIGNRRHSGADAVDGVVRENPIGVCLQYDHDPERLTTSVHFIDNGVNLQATDMPVPEPIESIPTL